ncbi:unnamed protein product, partial [Adineta steineri]
LDTSLSQYIPYIAKVIVEKRSLLKLHGLLIGAGWIDPISLYNSYLPYAIANNLVKNNSELYTNITRLVALCQDILSKQYSYKWKDFTESVHNAFQAFNSKPSIDLLPDLLGQIPILFYNGEYDLVCNHLAAENMLDNMTWNGESAGYIRYARNLTYILFFNAGHMVPYDQARRSQAMLYQFIQLNLSYPNNQIGTNRKSNYAISIVFTVIVSIIVFIGVIWLFILKQQQCVRITSVYCPNLFRSRQQSTTYSPFKIMNDEFVTFEDDVLA